MWRIRQSIHVGSIQINSVVNSSIVQIGSSGMMRTRTTCPPPTEYNPNQPPNAMAAPSTPEMSGTHAAPPVAPPHVKENEGNSQGECVDGGTGGGSNTGHEGTSLTD